MGVTRVMINDEAIAHDLLVQQGKLYSDKPDFPATLGMKAGFFLPLMGVGMLPSRLIDLFAANKAFAGDTFSRHRNFVMGFMKTSRLQGFYGHPAVETCHTLRRLMDQPSEYWSQNLIIHCARSAALCAWGSAEEADTLIEIVPPLLKFLSPGGPLPNPLPFLGRLPASLSPWKQAESRRRDMTDAAFLRAWSEAMKSVSTLSAGTLRGGDTLSPERCGSGTLRHGSLKVSYCTPHSRTWVLPLQLRHLLTLPLIALRSITAPKARGCAYGGTPPATSHRPAAK